MGRILISAIVGGIIVFMWGFVSHMVLPIGELGQKILPQEELVVGALKASITEPGLYVFPGGDADTKVSPEEEQKYLAGPRGMLLYDNAVMEEFWTRRLVTEGITDVVAALLAAIALSFTAVGYGMRVAMVAMLGLFGWVSISVPHWNWYGFPTAFVGAEAIDQVAGWLLAGLAIAGIVRGKSGGGFAGGAP